MNIHVGLGYLTQLIRNVRQCDEALAQGGEISLSYTNKRVDGFIFCHLKTPTLFGNTSVIIFKCSVTA